MYVNTDKLDSFFYKLFVYICLFTSELYSVHPHKDKDVKCYEDMFVQDLEDSK